jgi:chemotaxis signal transduction protein
MSANTTANSWYQPTVTAAPTIELVIFDINDVKVGLPIAKIDRVVNHTSTSTALNLPNIHSLDLHQQLFGISASDPAAYVIVRKDKQQMCSIPVDTVPTFTTVNIDRIRTIPPELRATSPIGIASHVAIISTELEESPIFILEV